MRQDATDTSTAPRRSWFRRRRSAEDRALTRETLPSVLFPQASTGDAPSVRSAMGLVDVYAAASVFARMFALLPWHHYGRTAGGGRRQLDDSTLGRLLRQPAAGIAAPAWRGHLGSTLALHGEAFVGIYRDGKGEPAQLGMLHPERVEVSIDGGEPLYTYTSEAGRRQDLTSRDVVHVRGPLTLDGVRGCSPIRHLRVTFATAKSLGEHADATWASNGVPPGLLKVPPGPGSDETAANLEREWHKRKKGRVAVLQGDVAFERIGLSNEDAQWVESANWSTQTVCRAFGLPPWALFAPSGESLQYSTVEGQLKAVITFSLAAWLSCAEGAFTAHPELCPGDTFAHVETEAVMRPDHQARAAWYSAALDPTTGWMRRDEVRALEDMPAESAQDRQEAPADA